ncbi:hypothetical protein SeMB42_g06961 [Synchytrium endobioticum]|uniref:p22-phox n=1 Tax=Synchytrium endobioticum TaxID=286115 RepID=A0A507D493_9FUNG|nr:hypothetical protein SeMB42_g06961 [Synchytrium endobioticum]TPX46329.1 hypothetical protein SeLEV6574_g03289 [Synchytrium endobioticum]
MHPKTSPPEQDGYSKKVRESRISRARDTLKQVFRPMSDNERHWMRETRRRQWEAENHRSRCRKNEQQRVTEALRQRRQQVRAISASMKSPTRKSVATTNPPYRKMTPSSISGRFTLRANTTPDIAALVDLPSCRRASRAMESPKPEYEAPKRVVKGKELEVVDGMTKPSHTVMEKWKTIARLPITIPRHALKDRTAVRKYPGSTFGLTRTAPSGHTAVNSTPANLASNESMYASHSAHARMPLSPLLKNITKGWSMLDLDAYENESVSLEDGATDDALRIRIPNYDGYDSKDDEHDNSYRKHIPCNSAPTSANADKAILLELAIRARSPLPFASTTGIKKPQWVGVGSKRGPEGIQKTAASVQRVKEARAAATASREGQELPKQQQSSPKTEMPAKQTAVASENGLSFSASQENPQERALERHVKPAESRKEMSSRLPRRKSTQSRPPKAHTDFFKGSGPVRRFKDDRADSLEFFLYAESLCRDDALTSQQIKDTVTRYTLTEVPGTVSGRNSNRGSVISITASKPIVTTGGSDPLSKEAASTPNTIILQPPPALLTVAHEPVAPDHYPHSKLRPAEPTHAHPEPDTPAPPLFRSTQIPARTPLVASTPRRIPPYVAVTRPDEAPVHTPPRARRARAGPTRRSSTRAPHDSAASSTDTLEMHGDEEKLRRSIMRLDALLACKERSRMGKFQWATWARLQALSAAFFVFTGGIVSVFYPNMYLALANIAIPVAIMLHERPVSSTVNISNYYVRAVVYLLCCAPTMVQAPTITGGLCLLCAAATYLRAAINGESYHAPGKSAKVGATKVVK